MRTEVSLAAAPIFRSGLGCFLNTLLAATLAHLLSSGKEAAKSHVLWVGGPLVLELQGVIEASRGGY